MLQEEKKEEQQQPEPPPISSRRMSITCLKLDTYTLGMCINEIILFFPILDINHVQDKPKMFEIPSNQGKRMVDWGPLHLEQICNNMYL